MKYMEQQFRVDGRDGGEDEMIVGKAQAHEICLINHVLLLRYCPSIKLGPRTTSLEMYRRFEL